MLIFDLRVSHQGTGLFIASRDLNSTQRKIFSRPDQAFGKLLHHRCLTLKFFGVAGIEVSLEFFLSLIKGRITRGFRLRGTEIGFWSDELLSAAFSAEAIKNFNPRIFTPEFILPDQTLGRIGGDQCWVIWQQREFECGEVQRRSPLVSR